MTETLDFVEFDPSGVIGKSGDANKTKMIQWSLLHSHRILTKHPEDDCEHSYS